jgi:phosphate transport system permease protein
MERKGTADALLTRDRVTAGVLTGAAALAGGITLLIVIYLMLGSLPALRAVGPLRFLADPSWSPVHGAYNLAPMLAGTLAVTAGAVLLATPLAVASAAFGRFYIRGPLSRVHRRLLETLAGIPSVVFGLWGLMVLVPAIARVGPPGPSVLAGMLVLALMILPTIALVADAALGAVPGEPLRGAAAVGLSRWAIVRSIALPAARPGIAVGVLLGTGRALGETMAVVMVMGNVVQVPESLLAPARTLTANIALEMAYATDAHRSALFVSGLVLALLTIGLVLAVDRIGARPRTSGASAHVV